MKSADDDGPVPMCLSLSNCYEDGVGDSPGCSSIGCSGGSCGVSSGVEVVIGSVAGCSGDEIAGLCLGS